MSNDMHPDLQWLAENVSEWNSALGFGYIGVFWDGGKPKADYVPGMAIDPDGRFRQSGHRVTAVFSQQQWLQARQDLGLVMSEEEEEAMPAKEHKRTAESFLKQAAELMKERGKQYDQDGGERSMGKTVEAFNAITGRNLSESEGWLLMGLLKSVRQYSGDYHRDSAEDKVAYAALEAESLEASALRAKGLEG